MPTEESLRAAFAVFDVDKSGTLTAEELTDVLMRPGGGQPFSAEDAAAEAVEERGGV